ncbi:hypothetical protein EROM_091290 [Encephalitozoon romaleae SJ-2008]|uniref:Uncharacterized protein n=1 Tax=Encephalitozoon romaleae (strain SJ-2008) TaxID=1178016 RepID=I7AG67_ENCRO|nr:hypothetical protein EROM_091290 [Encephalitozoon romaleae SJ-2008]AFN83745.1 hypothetical protein EROM_091290 [Encephalitozoon romaleae SJ-2008]
MTSAEDRELGLEKKIHKAALLETVDVLNKVADKRDKGGRKKAYIKSEEKENKSKKDVQRKADRHGIKPSKQKRNAMKKCGQTTDEKEDKDLKKCPMKMTRKERRLEKLKNKGKGPSSKEYYEKFIKKYKDKSPEKKVSKDILPSKRKEDFPKDDDSKRKKTPFSQKKKR